MLETIFTFKQQKHDFKTINLNYCQNKPTLKRIFKKEGGKKRLYSNSYNFENTYITYFSEHNSINLFAFPKILLHNEFKIAIRARVEERDHLWFLFFTFKREFEHCDILDLHLLITLCCT